MTERLSDERLRSWIANIEQAIEEAAVDGELPTLADCSDLCREALALRREVDNLQATVQAAWVDGYMDRSRPNPSRVTVAIAYDKVKTMPDALMLRQLWGDPRKPAPRGVLTASHDATLAAPPALGGEG